MNLEEIKALAVYAEQSRRMTWRIEEDCTEKLNAYVRETCRNTLVIPIYELVPKIKEVYLNMEDYKAYTLSGERK